MLNRRIFPATSLVFAALLTFQTAQGAQMSDLLANVPADSWGFVVAPSLDRIDAKAAKLKSLLALTYPDQVTDLALAPLALGDTVDRSAPICIVMMNANQFAGAQNAAVLMVGAKDPKALLEKLAAEEATDGISKCSVMGQPAFAAVKKNVVILGPSQDCVLNVLKTKKTLGDGFAASRKSAMDAADFYLSVSVAALNEAYREMYVPLLQMAMAANDPTGESAKMIIKAVSELDAVDFAISLNDDQIVFKMLLSAVKESDLDGVVMETKTSKSPLIASLPREKYLACWGRIASSGPATEKFAMGGGLGSMLKNLQIEGLDEEAMGKLDDVLKRLQKSIKQYAVSISALPDGSDGMFAVALVAETDDAKQFMEDARSAYEKAWKLSDDEDVATARKNIVHKADAETIAGKKVDTIRVDLDAMAEMGEGDEAELENAKKIFGKECVVRFGACDATHVVVAFGGGTQRYEKICENLESGGKGLCEDAGIARESKHLPSPRAGEFYLAIDHILQAVNAAMQATGEDPLPFEVPTLDAPVAMSNTVEDHVFRADIVIPMKLVVEAKKSWDKYSESAAEENFDEEMGDEEGAAEDTESEKPQDADSKSEDDAEADSSDE